MFSWFSPSLLALVLGFLLTAGAFAEGFEPVVRPADGRTLAAEITDVDGDGRNDVVRFVSRGFPPEETRWVQVYLQDSEHRLAAVASREIALPQSTAAYDLADIRDAPGEELLLLQPDGIEILSLASPAVRRWKIETGPGTTLGAATDERGLERINLVFNRNGTGPAFIGVPTFQEFIVLSTEGEPRGRLSTHGRANYFIPQNSGLSFLESDVQIYFDAPHMSVGHVDSDGILDIVASNRHQVRIYRGRSGGGFPSQPDVQKNLGIISEEDQIRGSGGVAIDVKDVDGDGLGDLVATYLGGNFSDATMETRVFMNPGDGWDLDSPDQVFRSESTVGLDRLVDLDGDGRLELVRGTISFSLLEFVETLLTRSVDARFAVHRLGPERRFKTRPEFSRDLDIPLSFDTFRPQGFLPVFGVDMNGDGYGDLVQSGDGDRVEVSYGGPAHAFEDTNVSFEMDTRGLLRIADWNGDGLMDLLVYDPRDPEATLRLAVNRGSIETPKKASRSTRLKRRKP